MTNAGQRIGDPDRERARAALERHAADGRLTLDELSDRLGVVYAAVTDSDLAHALHGLPPLPSATDIVESIHKLGQLSFRGALSRHEFATRKAELLTGLATIAQDDVDYALDELTRLSNRGMLSRKEFAAAQGPAPAVHVNTRCDPARHYPGIAAMQNSLPSGSVMTFHENPGTCGSSRCAPPTSPSRATAAR